MGKEQSTKYHRTHTVPYHSTELIDWCRDLSQKHRTGRGQSNTAQKHIADTTQAHSTVKSNTGEH
jgi:hypothetical protein